MPVPSEGADGSEPASTVTGERDRGARMLAADTLGVDLDTAHVRNLVRARVFGETIDPIRIDRFPVLHRIGGGAMGVVYAAYDNELDRKIAIKLLHPGMLADEEQRRRLLREAKALARLSHPGVVQVYEAGEVGDQVYLAMEFVRGDSVRTWLESGKRSQAEILDVFVQAARGLAAAHDAGLVHRDVKPDNIVVGSDGRVRVVDFGLAIDHDALPPVAVTELEPSPAPLDRWTRTRGFAGTPAYMAPEQLAGEPTDERGDEFSLAVALYEALVGARPYVGSTLAELASALQAGPPEIPRRTGVPRHVAAALRRALAFRAEDRFARLAELIAAIERPPAVRLRWRFVVVASLVILMGLLIAVMTRVTGMLLEAAQHNAALVDDQADHAVIVAADAALAHDPTHAIELLAGLRAEADAWADTAWPIAQRAAETGIATSILELPPGMTAFRFAGEAAAATTGTAYGRIELETGEYRELLRDEPLDVVSVDLRHRVSVDGGLRLRVLADGSERVLDPGSCTTPRWSNDGTAVAARCGSDDAPISVWHIDGSARRRVAVAGALAHVGDAGDHVLTRDDAGVLRWADVRTGAAHELGVVGTPLSIDEARATLVAATASGVAIAALDGTHTDAITVPTQATTAAISHTGDLVAVGGLAGELWWIDRSTAPPTVERGAEADGARVKAMAFSPDDRELVSVPERGITRIWDVVGRRVHTRLVGQPGVRAARWRDHGELETLGPASVNRWRSSSPRALARGVAGVVPCGDGEIIGHRSGEIVRHRSGTRTVLATIPGLATMHASADCRTIVASTRDRHRVLVLVDGVVRRELASTHFVSMVAVAEAGDRVAWIDDCALQILDVDADVLDQRAPLPGGCMRALATMDDALVVVEAPSTAGPTALRRFAAFAEELPPWTSPVPISRIRHVPGTATFVITGEQGVAVLEPASGILRDIATSNRIVLAVAVSPDGRWLAILPWQRPLRLVDLASETAYDTTLGESYDDSASFVAEDLGPLEFTSPTALLVVDPERTAYRLALGVPRGGDELRAWVRDAVPTRRSVAHVAE